MLSNLIIKSNIGILDKSYRGKLWKGVINKETKWRELEFKLIICDIFKEGWGSKEYNEIIIWGIEK